MNIYIYYIMQQRLLFATKIELVLMAMTRESNLEVLFFLEEKLLWKFWVYKYQYSHIKQHLIYPTQTSLFLFYNSHMTWWI